MSALRRVLGWKARAVRKAELRRGRPRLRVPRCRSAGWSGTPGGQDQPLAHPVPAGAHCRRGHRRPRQDRCAPAAHRQRRARPPLVEGPLRLPRLDLRDHLRVDVDPRRAARQRRGARHVRPRGRPARLRIAHHAAVHHGLLDEHPYAELHDELAQGRRTEGRHRQRGVGARPGRRFGHRERHGACIASIRPRPPPCTGSSVATTRPRSCARRRAVVSAACS